MAGHRFNPEKANKLIDPKRKEIVNPEKIVSLLGLSKNDIVADLGAGNGFFTVPFAKSTERVYAVDIEPKMLELLKERMHEENIHNIVCIESDLEQIMLEDNSVDKAFTAFVMHEIPDMKKALAEFERIVKPGGQFMIVDWEAVESDMGPPVHHRISSEDMVKVLDNQGYKSEVTHVHDSVYVVNVRTKKNNEHTVK
ncbi:class I SAM-dependent methyltransferase [Bacillus sp. HMF5848]|uniref:class I SAM-dependent methyltransferase n=1 Tax=Bacillus sp. HMF5848 TaxID=2495421 RepID=UPI000F7B864E|nr:methyltransferase domain-containing protein [Bacillus sp. HMF5848]RSK26236.1 class I SAM-dependent methyltransferase [Bacillus sp. HMF5848]